jgi:hypothetical protein
MPNAAAPEGGAQCAVAERATGVCVEV